MASYKAEIQVVAKGLKGVDKLATSVKKLNKAVQQSNKLKKSSTDTYSQQLKSQSNLLKTQIADQRQLNSLLEQETKLRRSSAKAVQAGRSRGGGGSGGRGRSQRFTDIATGAGFPLLFGGGPLQALAGGLGGAAGGLGGAIAASAIVAQLEGFARAAAETGVALTSTSGALELMRDKSLFSSDAAREHAAALEELGQVEELAAHLTQEMALAIGNNGVNALQGLGDTTKETTRLWNLLTTQLFKLISGPLQGFLNIVNQVLGGITGAASREAFFGDLGTQEAAARARFKELTGESLGTGRSGKEKRAEAEAQGRVFLSQEDALAQIRKEFQPQVTAKIPVTAQDRRDITPGGTKAGRRSRIPDLNAEIGLQERLLTLNNQIAQAKRDENPVREAALQMEVAMEQQAAKRAIIDAKRIPEAEKILEKQLLELQTDQQILEIQNRLKDVRAAQAEKAQDTIDGLLAEQALLQATLDGKEEEVALEQRIKEILKDNKLLTEDEVRGILKASQALREKIRLQQESEARYKQLATTIQNGVVDGIMSALDGTKSLAESLSGVLKQLAKMFISAGVGSFNIGGKGGSGLLGLLPGFANGGRPPVGRPSIVGERGPELFVPRSSGTIVPNHALGGSANVTVNVDASGSSVEGDANQAGRLGKAIGIAVQQELIKQKRPGGLLGV